MNRIPIKKFKVTYAPAEPAEANAEYYALNTDLGIADSWVTDEGGNLYLVGNSAFVQAMIAAAARNLTAPMLLSSVLVDLNDGSAAKQALYTVPASRRGKPSQIEIDFLSDAPENAEFTIGWNDDADDVLGDPFHLADLITDTADCGQLLAPSRSIRVGTAAQVLGLAVTTPEGSTLTARINTYGHLTTTLGVPVGNIL
jgi:hypothetical protein